MKNALITGVADQHGAYFAERLRSKEVDIEIRWERFGVEEKECDAATGDCIVEIDPRYFRPTEAGTLQGDATDAREELEWVPKISFEEMIRREVREDLEQEKRNALCPSQGFRTLNRHQ